MSLIKLPVKPKKKEELEPLPLYIESPLPPPTLTTSQTPGKEERGVIVIEIF
jgi:hypothetical protein